MWNNNDNHVEHEVVGSRRLRPSPTEGIRGPKMTLKPSPTEG